MWEIKWSLMQKLILPRECHNKCTSIQVWGQSKEDFVKKVCNSMEHYQLSVSLEESNKEYTHHVRGQFDEPFLEKPGNCSVILRMPVNGKNSVEHDQKLIIPGMPHKECIHQAWSQSHNDFGSKCAETLKCDGWKNKWMNEWTDGWGHLYDSHKFVWQGNW